MKKIISLLVIAFVFASCSEEISRNNPAFEGLKDNVIWRAGGATGTLAANGFVTISGGLQFETLTLHTNSAQPQTYQLGVNNQSRVVFTSTAGFEEVTYTTGTGVGNGQIIIEEYDEAGRTISGTFRFNAINTEDPDDVLNFQEGIFYKVPIYPAVED